jgi:hypothetical protein
MSVGNILLYDMKEHILDDSILGLIGTENKLVLA